MVIQLEWMVTHFQSQGTPNIRDMLYQQMRFPGGSAVKNPLANAKDSFHHWFRKNPLATGQLSLCTTATEPVL